MLFNYILNLYSVVWGYLKLLNAWKVWQWDSGFFSHLPKYLNFHLHSFGFLSFLEIVYRAFIELRHKDSVLFYLVLYQILTNVLVWYRCLGVMWCDDPNVISCWVREYRSQMTHLLTWLPSWIFLVKVLYFLLPPTRQDLTQGQKPEGWLKWG